MAYPERPGDRDQERERDWIRDERLRARDAYDDDDDRRRLARSYSDRDYGRDYSSGGGEYSRSYAARRAERDYGSRGYIPYGVTGPTNYGGGYSGDPQRHPGDIGRGYAEQDSYGYRTHEIPRGHYLGDTSPRRANADYVPNPREGRGEEARTWWNRATDELSAFFGDEDARRRREWDEMRSGMRHGSYQTAGEHRGRGPRGYRRSDDRIREDISDRLTDDPWLDASYIDVEVKDGEVTLMGTVMSRDDKRRAEDLAESCSGVGHVQNNLRVQQSAQASSAGERATLETGGTAATQANTTTTGRA